MSQSNLSGLLTQVFVCGSRHGVLVASCNPLLLLSPQMLTYFSAFEVFFEENLPKLFAHFKTNNLTPDIYLIDWWVSPSRVPQLDPFSSPSLFLSAKALVFLTVSPELSARGGRCCQVVHRVHFVLYSLSQFRCLVVFRRKPHGQILWAGVCVSGLRIVENYLFAFVTHASLVPELTAAGRASQ